MPGIVEEPPKRKLIKPVIITIIIIIQVVIIIIPQLLRVDGIKVGSVRIEEDAGLVRRLLATEPGGEVDGVEEGVLLDLLGAVDTDPLVGGRAQGEDQVLGLRAQAGTTRHVHKLLPVYHLK